MTRLSPRRKMHKSRRKSMRKSKRNSKCNSRRKSKCNSRRKSKYLLFNKNSKMEPEPEPEPEPEISRFLSLITNPHSQLPADIIKYILYKIELAPYRREWIALQAANPDYTSGIEQIVEGFPAAISVLEYATRTQNDRRYRGH